jgi:2-keto-4-pentenoate hydratase/2-oxohepta-3-ene-1,7-dioic acid hydratase in catechol pathway
MREDGIFDLGRRIGTVLPDLKSFLSAQGLGILCNVPKATVTDYARGEFSYLPVIPNPAKILCVGLNYEEHRRETGRPDAEHPAIFTRFADTLIGHESPILLPLNSSALDYEGELAIIIGKSGFRLNEDEAMNCIGGYSVFNDTTLRDWQRHTHQFTPGKNFPNTGSFGPALITPQEAGPLAEKTIETHVNGKTMQSAQLGDMIFSIPRIIAYLSGFTRLSPGDIIATGTPGGVGFKRDPQIFLQRGDWVDVAIEGIGTLANIVELEAISSEHASY